MLKAVLDIIAGCPVGGDVTCVQLMFGIGLYTGIYIDQKYQVPSVDDPQALYNKLKQYIDQYKKKED